MPLPQTATTQHLHGWKSASRRCRRRRSPCDRACKKQKTKHTSNQSKQRQKDREQLAAFAEIVETGPDRTKDGVVRWRRIDLKRVIEERFGVVYHERTIGKILKQIGFSHISARPRHPGQKIETIAAFKKTSRRR